MAFHVGRKINMEEQPPFLIWTKQGQPLQIQQIQPSQVQQLAQPTIEVSGSVSGPSGSLGICTTSEGVINEKFTCNECSKVFDCKDTFLSHKKTHSVEKSFQCSTCNRTFVNSRNLLVHTRNHTGARPFVCPECDKAFTQRSMLTVHRRIHTGEKPNHCGECGKSFYRTDHLTKHKRTHSGEKPYNCVDCGKAFADSSALRQHVKRHREISPFICDCCKESFDKKVMYDLHMMDHKGLKPEECDVCWKQFPSKGLLTSHRRNHLKEKVFSCEMCVKTFARVVTLKKHLKYYHGVNSSKVPSFNDSRQRKSYGENKPFKCDECGLIFTNNGKFLSHQQTHQSFQQYKCDKCGMSFAKSFTLDVHKQMHSADANNIPVANTTQAALPTVTIPILTFPVMTSLPSGIEINTEKKETFTTLQNVTTTATLGANNNDNLGVVKILSLRPVEGDVKAEIHCDPLAVATAAAQLTTPDIVENFTLFDQPSYSYQIPTQITTISEIEAEDFHVKDKGN